MHSYDDEDALQNALFLKTNRILTMIWGVLYLFTSVFTWLLMRTSVSSFVWLINSVLPIFMGIFYSMVPEMVSGKGGWGQ